MSDLRVVLWRHGRTEWNAAGRFQGQRDTELDASGIAEASAAATTLATLGPTRIVSSDAVRATATAALLADRTDLRVDTDKRLREIDLGAWTGLTRDEASAQFPEEYAAWYAGSDAGRGGGESYPQVAQRARAAVDERLTADSDGVVVVVSHGGTSRALIGSLLELPSAAWWRLSALGNARWSVVVQTSRGWRLAEHNVGAVP
ncbi:MAG: histidine phosphatase family protein [Mycobacteriales bacterium]